MSEDWLIVIFAIVVVIMLLLDLGVFNKKEHEVSTKEAGIWTVVWIVVSCLFGIFIYVEYGSEKCLQYFSAYLTEKSLSLDNIFVFVLIFYFYKIQELHKHKILFWGIIGAIVLRAVFIFAGVELINLTYIKNWGINIEGFEHFNILLFVFAIILLVSGMKTFKQREEEEENKDFDNNPVIRMLKKMFPLTLDQSSGKFFVVENGVRMMTPLFIAMITIELSDVIFAVDSVPAIFGISKDPIILYTSNIFAILGLRSMYFLLSNVIKYFARLQQGIATILTFIGVKMLIAEFGIDIPSLTSLFIILFILALSIIVSIIETKKKNRNKQHY